MKKVILLLAVVLGFSYASAQDEGTSAPTSTGTWLVEVNTGFGTAANGAGLSSIGSYTGIGYANGKSGDYKWSQFSGGAEGGYFIADNFAIKAGLGFSTYDADNDAVDTNAFSYMLGSKYYIKSMIPVQLDFRGSTIKDAEENPLWIGLQGGYAVFLNDFMSIEPGLRYDFSLNEDAYDGGMFSFRVGFAAFF